MEIFLELLKITLPALIVFITVYSILKKYMDSQYNLQLLKHKQSNSKTSTPLRLQALERFSLFIERISIPALLLRIRTPEMSSGALKVGLLIAIQKEFEHNITQQLYVSDQLWQIISITKNDLMNIVEMASNEVDPKSNSKELAVALYKFIDEHKESYPIEKALRATKSEANILMG